MSTSAAERPMPEVGSGRESTTVIDHRRNAEKRAAVDRALDDPAMQGLSNRLLGRRCGVSHELVARRRADRSGRRCQMGEVRIAERSGRRYEIRIAGINAGRSSCQAPVPCSPVAAPRDQLGKELTGDAGLTYQVWTQRLGAILTAAREIVAQWQGTKDDLLGMQREGRLAAGRVGAMQSVMVRTAGLMRFHLDAIERGMPFAVCPSCAGVRPGCPACGDVGWVDRARHEAIVLRAAR